MGKLILEAAGVSNCKRVTLEMGGKSPLVIFDDANRKYHAYSTFSKKLVPICFTTKFLKLQLIITINIVGSII